MLLSFGGRVFLPFRLLKHNSDIFPLNYLWGEHSVRFPSVRRKGEAVLQEGLSSMPKVTQLLRPVTGHRLDAEVLNFFFSL